MQDDKWNKFVLICKPEQSGKTFIMIENIIKDLSEPIGDKVVVNIILCDNNLLLTKQTGARVESDLEEFMCNDTLYIEFSSHKRTRFHDANSVAGAIVTKGVRNVLCCTNGVRIDDIYNIITDINNSEFTKGKIHWKIWLDEADKFPNFIQNTFVPLVDEHEDINIYCITATPKILFDKYDWMNVLPLEKSTTDNYHGWLDNDIRLIECEYDSVQFISHVLNKIAIAEIKPATKWFIPGESRKASHYKIKDLCVKLGFAVFVVNGDGLKLYLPTLELFEYEKDIQLNDKIRYLYVEKNLHKYPLAITGNICIGRGISIMSNDFMIDFAILSVIASQSEVSQISGRVKGNIKHWSNYKKPIIYTTPTFNKIAIKWEKKSRNLAELAFRKQQDGDITIIKKSEFKTLGDGFTYVRHPEPFLTYAKAKDFLKTKEREIGCKVGGAKKEAIVLKDGYALSTRYLPNGKTKDTLTKEDRLFKENVDMISDGFSISSNTGTRWLILPYYENVLSHPRSVRFEVRYIKFQVV